MSRWWVIILAAIVIAGLLWQIDEQEEATPSRTEEVQAQEPDAFAVDVDYTFLRPDGTAQYHLRAEEIRQFDADDLTRLTAPRLSLFSLDQPPWKVRANHGYIRKRVNAEEEIEETVYLREEVELMQETVDRGQLIMRSNALYIYPHRQYAETDRGVIIDSEVGRTVAASLKANLATGVLDLSSSSSQRVHTIVLPEQFKKK